MDKKDWKTSLKNLTDLLKIKKEQLQKMRNDIEEIEYSVECYKRKV